MIPPIWPGKTVILTPENYLDMFIRPAEAKRNLHYQCLPANQSENTLRAGIGECVKKR
jgi:hypothetical protein